MKKKASTDLINKNTVSEEFLEFKRKVSQLFLFLFNSL